MVYGIAIIKRFIPHQVRVKMQNWMVDTLSEAYTDERWRKLIRSYRSDAVFHEAFEKALEKAVERFAREYPDQELVDALTLSTRFWDLPSVQYALKEMITKPSSYLVAERSAVVHSFADVLPTVEPGRVGQAVSFFLHCLVGEVINIPQLAPIYQVQLHWASYNQARQMIDTLRGLQLEQRQLLTSLLEAINQNQFLLAAPAEQPASLLVSNVHYNLPPLFGEFLGREEDVKRVLEGIRSRWPLISIEGMAGIGKTTLAIQVARYCLPGSEAALDPPFKYVVWVSAKDAPERKSWLNEVLDAIARVLGYPLITKLLQEQKQNEIDQLLRNHRTLVILDDFHMMKDRDPDIMPWIYHIPDPSKILINERYNKVSGAWLITLKGLEEPKALELIRNHARRLALRSIEAASDDALLDLVRITGGNPKAIELALGYVWGSLSLSEVIKHLYTASKTVDNLFDYLFDHAWKTMTPDAQQVLMVIPFFEDFANKEALGVAAELTDYQLDMAVSELVKFMLLDSNEDWKAPIQQYSVHPLTRAFANARLREKREFEEQARIRWGQYYIEFAARALERGNHNERYWNTLISTSSRDALIDQEWRNLRKVLAWAEAEKHDSILLELMLMLVHYMDVHWYYPVRLYYARRAASAAKRLNRKEDEALLYIDALGWTHIEVGSLEVARREILKGLRIAQSLNDSGTTATDLIALANTYLARVFLGLGDLKQASEFIENAMAFESTPVNRCRVDMIAGDVALKKNNHPEALKLYENALHCSSQYRDEGESSELFYRLGLAYLANEHLTDAEAHFKRVVDVKPETINVELIHAKYGLARVAKVKGEREKARQLAEETWKDLSSLVPSHFLLKEIEDFLTSLEAN